MSSWLPAPRHAHTQSRLSDHPIQHQVTTPTPTHHHPDLLGACLFPSDGQRSESAHDGAPCQP
ncbi:MAG: hypothetical protein ACK56I_34930, partial [bacterium]